MATGPWDEALLTELSDAMRDASICGLGQAAPNPLLRVESSRGADKPLGMVILSETNDRTGYGTRRCRTPGDGKPGTIVTRRGRGKTVTFTLDGDEVDAREGETIWQVAKRQGTDIPHLCYAPEPGYRPDGNCRACMVEIEGERVLAASCIRTPTPA